MGFVKSISRNLNIWSVFLDESGTDRAECSRKIASRRRFEGAIRSQVNTRDLQLECIRILHETLLVPVLMYISEIMLWKEKERSRVRTVQMDNLRRKVVVLKIECVSR